MNELQKIKTTTACCLTGSREAAVVATKDRHGRPLRTVICVDSGLVFTDPRPTPKQVREFYVDQYRKEYKGTEVPKKKHILRAGRTALGRFAKIKPYLPESAAMLDVGSGGGEFVYACTRMGYKACGIEPNRGYARFSVNEYGINVFGGAFQDVEFDKDQFDCITMFHVLEHLDEPVHSISKLSRFLRVGGHLFVEVPNVDSTRTGPNQKWHVGHLYNFSAKTLAATGVKAGLKLIDLQTPGDGCNLFAIFEKPATPHMPDLVGTLAGSFESTYQVLSGHSNLRHYAKFHVPLRRLLAKIHRTADEQHSLKIYRERKPIEILNDLVVGKAIRSVKAASIL